MLYSIHCFYFSVWILESLRQGLHVVASWDYHQGAKIRDSVRGNPGRFIIANWDGPFIIHEVLRPVTYKIRYEDGRVVTNAWNIEHLRQFYPWVNIQNSYINK
jgi:hypothetical protein